MAQFRRFRVGDVLATTFAVSFRYLLLFSVVQLVLNAPVLIVSLFVDPSPPSFLVREDPVAGGDRWLQIIRNYWGYLVGPIAAGFFCYVVIRHLHRSQVTIGDTLRVVSSKFLRLLATGVLAWLLFAVWLVPSAVFFSYESVGLGMLAGIVGFPIAIVFVTAASVSTPAVVGEDLGPIAAIRRSFALTRGYRPPVFGSILVMSFLVGLVAFGTTSLVNVANLDFRTSQLTISAVTLLAAIPSTVLSSVIYTHLRRVKEGATSQQLIAVFE